MSEKAVIDRFEDDWAVLLVGENQRRFDAKRAVLPTDAREGDWLQVEIEGEQLLSAVADAETTAQTSARIMSKLERLRRGEHLK